MPFPIARSRLWLLGVYTGMSLLAAGCSASRPLNVPGLESSQVIKAYQALYIPASRPPWTASGIEVSRDDIAVVMAFGKATTWKGSRSSTNVPPERYLYGRVNDGEPFQMRTNPVVAEVEEEGELRVTVRDWRTVTSINPGCFRRATSPLGGI